MSIHSPTCKQAQRFAYYFNTYFEEQGQACAERQTQKGMREGSGACGAPKGRLEMKGLMSVASTRRPSSALIFTAAWMLATSSLPSPGTCQQQTLLLICRFFAE